MRPSKNVLRLSLVSAASGFTAGASAEFVRAGGGMMGAAGSELRGFCAAWTPLNSGASASKRITPARPANLTKHTVRNILSSSILPYRRYYIVFGSAIDELVHRVDAGGHRWTIHHKSDLGFVRPEPALLEGDGRAIRIERTDVDQIVQRHFPLVSQAIGTQFPCGEPQLHLILPVGQPSIRRRECPVVVQRDVLEQVIENVLQLRRGHRCDKPKQFTRCCARGILESDVAHVARQGAI